MIAYGIFVINVNCGTKTEGANIGAVLHCTVACSVLYCTVPAGVETSQKLSQELATMSTRGQ